MRPLSLTTYFQRYEQKYLLNTSQYHALSKILDKLVCPDAYGVTTIYSVYYDNGNFEIARKVLDKSVYKEKLRLRSYGIPHHGDTVYLELKKKFEGITYKQRVPVVFTGMETYFNVDLRNSGRGYISDEIIWFLYQYKPSPQFMISYDRAAFQSLKYENLRITFDTNIRWRSADLDFSKGPYGTPLLDKGEFLMELKTDKSIPLFLSSQLAILEIFPISFSKYRMAYESLLNSQEVCYA
jgi:SPX domain protein involved in polyphosphate accumulation